MHQAQIYGSRIPVLTPHIQHSIISPRNSPLNTLRPSPSVYLTPASTQSHLIQGNLPINIQHTQPQPQQVLIKQRSQVSITQTRQSHDLNIIPGFLVSTQGERECDFKLAGEDFMRIKDINSEYCYKFRVTSNIPSIQFHSHDNLRLLLSFSGDYIEDLYKFVSALEDNRFSIRRGQRLAVLEFRFAVLEHKNQVIELIQSIPRRGPFSGNSKAPTLGNYRSVATLHSPQLHFQESAPVTIQSINQGHRSDRNHNIEVVERVQRVQHVNVNHIPEVGVATFNVPPVPLVSFPQPAIIQQETFMAQPMVQIAQHTNMTSYESTEILRLSQQNKVLNSSLLAVQQQNKLTIQENSRLYIELNNVKQQIELLRSQAYSTTNYNEGETIRLRTQLTQISSNLISVERKLRETQLELSQSKASEVQAKNERESLRVSYTRQVSELETKISIMSGTSTGATTEISSLRRQYEQQKSSNVHLQGEIVKLQQLLDEAEKRLIEYEVGLREVKEQISVTFDEERNYLGTVISQKNSQIHLLNQRIFQLTHNEQQLVTVTETETTTPAIVVQQFELEKQRIHAYYHKLEVEYENLRQTFDTQVYNLSHQIQHRNQIIIQLETELNIQIQSKNTQNVSSANLEAVQKMRGHYEEQITKLKNMYETEYQNLNHQIVHLQGIISEQHHQFRSTVDEYTQYRQSIQSSVGVQGNEEIWQQVEFFRGRVIELEHEREHLINVIENYKIELHRRTVQSNLQGSEIIQSESIERVTTQFGGQEVESIDRITYQENAGDQRTITRYELNDGQERYIHKVTSESVEGRVVHELDTNIVAHREQGELVYDIETEERTYQGGERYASSQSQNQVYGVEHQTGYGFVSQPITHSIYSETSQGQLYNTVYSESNVEVISGSRGGVVIEGAGFEINVPQGTTGVQITEESYVEVRRDEYYR